MEAFADQAAAVPRPPAAAGGRRSRVDRPGDAFRTGLLRSVSHDLRTPLAGIKASVTSLLADDVTWSPDVARDFLQTIDADCDRLTRLVGNLLDASRLQADAVPVARWTSPSTTCWPTRSEACPGPRTPSGSGSSCPTTCRCSPPTRPARTVLANVVANALRYSPPDRPVRVCGDAVNDRVELLVIDRGKGIPAARREVVLRPFQRLGDQEPATGIGLGLAVAHGFTELLGGQLLSRTRPAAA